jgi:hypothetical protein
MVSWILAAEYLLAADPPAAEIRNGNVEAKVWLPDPANAFTAPPASIGPVQSAASNTRGATSMVPGSIKSIPAFTTSATTRKV